MGEKKKRGKIGAKPRVLERRLGDKSSPLWSQGEKGKKKLGKGGSIVEKGSKSLSKKKKPWRRKGERGRRESFKGKLVVPTEPPPPPKIQVKKGGEGGQKHSQKPSIGKVGPGEIRRRGTPSPAYVISDCGSFGTGMWTATVCGEGRGRGDFLRGWKYFWGGDSRQGKKKNQEKTSFLWP